MRREKGIAIIVLIILNLILVSIIHNVINKVILTNQKQIIKKMSATEYENSITLLNESHTAYANYIEQSRINLASAIINAGVTTASNAPFETMIDNIHKFYLQKQIMQQLQQEKYYLEKLHG